MEALTTGLKQQDQYSDPWKKSIPVPATPILGRDQELEEIGAILKVRRIVTITGTGGIGKTRTALEICDLVQDRFDDGMVFISMATLSDAKEFMPTLADTLGVTEAAHRDLAVGVADVISDKRALLILDNLEHVITAATEISTLVSRCSNLSILCTSRTPLKIRLEQVYPLSPLSLPTKMEFESLSCNPAVRLFISRAKEVNKDFELTRENAQTMVAICRRLDGLPLALELAAARLRLLSPEQLLQHLNEALHLLTKGPVDAPVRHHTLRSTINWSYALLNDQERQLFRRLGVFTKGFTLDTIQIVCNDKAQSPIQVINEVESLLDKALIEKTDLEGRFTLLQTIKDFALEQLAASEEDDLFFHKHAHFFAEFSKTIEEGTQGKQQQSRMKLALAEESNVFAALDYFLVRLQAGDQTARETGLDICGSLWMYWHIRGKHNSAKAYIQSFLGDTDNLKPSKAICRALFCLHVATFTLGDVEESRQVAFRLFKMAEAQNNELEIAKGLFGLAFGHLHTDLELAKSYSEKAVYQFRKLEYDYWLGFALWQNGLFNLIGGDLEKASNSYAESLKLFQKTGDKEGIGCALSGLSMLKFIAGEYNKAISMYQETLGAFRSVGDRPEQARILYEMSWAYLATKDTQTALNYIMDSIQAHQEVGSIRGMGLSMNGLAALEAVRGRPRRAIEIAAAAQQFAREQGVAIEFGVSNHGKVYLDRAKKALSRTEFDTAEQKGRKYSLKDILRQIEAEFNTFQTAGKAPPENPFIMMIYEAMEVNFSDSSFGVHELYQALSMSQMQVYRKLKELCQLTPSQFIRRYRLQKGKELLSTSDVTIAEVAYDTGFTDPNYFSRAFQKAYGQSPTQYRNQTMVDPKLRSPDENGK